MTTQQETRAVGAMKGYWQEIGTDKRGAGGMARGGTIMAEGGSAWGGTVKGCMTAACILDESCTGILFIAPWIIECDIIVKYAAHACNNNSMMKLLGQTPRQQKEEDINEMILKTTILQ